ncbi:hypothetical protein F9L16_21355 [Agarivorans sp. B2Z047]|uniref:competence protein CoiA family protein n=1 Tax=Agarivorans sp. B2Z047 TaxID=2652721 RepID=UPI00128DEB75|nr:competence protein CoiA family protein [Agarivorans sp. B2Z047]MPW31526.1 hypothetical protein [Agarivorans sp. B2Z047]UQN42569.1 hypothetical protein LQZ07_22785 [Agarivorans sp. B2Z047]
MKHLKLKYALRGGELVHISQVESGDSQGCICSACSKAIVAKKGTKREHHFAHKAGDSCEHAVETALHDAAKEVLNRHRKICLPATFVTFTSYRENFKISNEKFCVIESLKIEQGISGIIPDLIAKIRGRELLIEVFVTHKVDSHKRQKIKKLGLSAIEIDLSKIPRDMPITQLEDLIVNQFDNKTWVNNERANKEYRKILSQTRKLNIILRGFASHVDYCPIRSRTWHGKPYANVIDDCLYCEHCLDVNIEDYVRCNGHIPQHEIYKPKILL